MDKQNYSRRNWIQLMTMTGTGLLLPTSLISCTDKYSGKNKMPETNTILLISGWQDVNIGDIAHTPGLLHVLETFLPDTEIILWKRSRSEEVEKLLSQNFPNVKIIHGGVDDKHNVDSPEVLAAFDKADLMLHGSGPSVVARAHLKAWAKHSDKPFGVFGTTIQHINDDLAQLLKKASFIYTRETKSLEILKEHGITNDNITFAPDATFYLHLKNDNKANTFLREHGLDEKKFICAIPRLRYTPYHEIRKVNWSEKKIKDLEETNKRFKEVDHAKLRQAMIAWVRETGNKVLVCPEMTYQVNIMDELLIDPLPEDVKPFVVKRGYWMPDEAASVYNKAHTVLSFECHSPIMALATGTPSFYLRQPEDTIKGQMYYDLGLKDWVFEIEETTGEQITNTLRSVWLDYEAAKQKLAASMNKVDNIYEKCSGVIKSILEKNYD